MPIHELIICGTPYHSQQTSATPQRAPELISLQCIGINVNLIEIKIVVVVGSEKLVTSKPVTTSQRIDTV